MCVRFRFLAVFGARLCLAFLQLFCSLKLGRPLLDSYSNCQKGTKFKEKLINVFWNPTKPNSFPYYLSFAKYGPMKWIHNILEPPWIYCRASKIFVKACVLFLFLLATVADSKVSNLEVLVNLNSLIGTKNIFDSVANWKTVFLQKWMWDPSLSIQTWEELQNPSQPQTLQTLSRTAETT